MAWDYFCKKKYVETVDKMTDRQIAAKVRQHFAE